MDSNTLLLLVTGVGAGVFAGMFGIGGGVVIVPILILFLTFSPVQAVSTSLAALLLPVSIFAVYSYHRANLLSIRAALLIAAGLLITSLIGAEIALALPAATLKQIYGVFLLYMGWRFAEPRKVWAERQKIRRGEAIEPVVSTEAGALRTPGWLLFGIGLVAGVFSGMFGIGGGAIIVPALVGFLNYDQKLAVGTSLAALLLPVGLPGVIRYYQAGELNIGVAIPVALGLAVGSLVGAQLALRLSSKRVRRLYGIFLLFTGTWFLVQPYITAAATR
jgi:uncharacterized membrane protein YfcA